MNRDRSKFECHKFEETDQDELVSKRSLKRKLMSKLT